MDLLSAFPVSIGDMGSQISPLCCRNLLFIFNSVVSTFLLFPLFSFAVRELCTKHIDRVWSVLVSQKHTVDNI